MTGCSGVTVSAPLSGGGGGGQTGFTIKADKVSSGQAFTARITISKPDGLFPLSSLYLVRTGLLGSSCVAQDLHLDANGQATVDVQVTETMTVQAVDGIGTCDLTEPLTRQVSNTLKLTVGTDWGTIALWTAGLLAAAYLVGSVVSRRK